MAKIVKPPTPVVIYTVDKNQVTQPDNVVTLNLDASYDPSGKPLKSYQHKTLGASPPVIFENAAAAVTKATLSTVGMYQFRGVVVSEKNVVGRGTLNVELKVKPNVAPVAIYAVDKSALTAPDKEINLSLAQSYDPDGRPLKSYAHVQIAGPAAIINTPGVVNSKATLSDPGRYIFEGTVEDDKGEKISSTITVDLAQQVYVTLFGCKFQDIRKADTKPMLDKFGMIGFRPSGETAQGYPTTVTDYKYYYDLGIKMILNIGWQRVIGGTIRAFPTRAELPEYEDKLNQIFIRNANGIYFAVVACENEPTNDGYFGSAPIDDYIEELRVFAKVAKSYGVDCCDGATHIGYLKILFDNGGNVPTSLYGDRTKAAQNQLKNAAEVKAIITAEAGMPDVTFSNFHHEFNAGTPAGMVLDSASYLSSVTKKRLICNEFSLNQVSQEVMQQTVTEFRQLNMKFANIWGGDGWPGEPATVPGEFDLNDIIWKLGLRNANKNDLEKLESPGDAINIGTDVTTVGDWYRKAAKYIVRQSIIK